METLSIKVLLPRNSKDLCFGNIEGEKKNTYTNNKITIYSVIIGIDTIINVFQPKEEEAAAKTQQSINPDVTFLFFTRLSKIPVRKWQFSLLL